MIFFAVFGAVVIAAVLVAAAMSLFLRRHVEPDTPTGGGHDIPEHVEGTPPR